MEQESDHRLVEKCPICVRQKLYETLKRKSLEMRLESKSKASPSSTYAYTKPISSCASCCIFEKTIRKSSFAASTATSSSYAHSENAGNSSSSSVYANHFATTCSCCERRPRNNNNQLYVSTDWNVYSSYRVEDYTKMYRAGDFFFNNKRCACKINYQIQEPTNLISKSNVGWNCKCHICTKGDKKYAKPIEPKYENIKPSPKYENLEEITRLHGDRLGPEGQNLEDEVQYENVTPSTNLKCNKNADAKNLSVSAGNLASGGDKVMYNSKEFVPPDFFSNNRSGTFPQYLQKEVKEVGLDGLKISAKDVSHNKNTTISANNKTKGVYKKIAKKEMCEVKQARLWLAQDEYKYLNNALAALDTSRTSLCSSGSGGSARYDPELLRSDVALAKERVARLQKELQQARSELTCTQQGVETLHSVEQKMSNGQGCYNITEVQAMMTEMENIQKSLISGEKEKAKLRQSLAKLKDDLTRLQLEDVSPETSTLSLPQEKLSTASQTDLCNEPIGTRLAEIKRMRLKYDESRKKIQEIQQQLVDLEDKVQPGQAESDKDRLLLCQEKEQLLRELKSITQGTRSKQEMSNIQLECKRLEQDLNNEVEISNRCIADRLRLHEEKQLLLQQLKDALKTMTTLESQLKNLSASTLSVSSSSSLGSLSTTSSKGSLSSGLSFTDIYGGPQCIVAPLTIDKPIDMADLRRRAERLLVSSSGSVLATGSGSQPSLSPRSSLSSVAPSLSPPISPPVARPPSYNLLAHSLKHLNEEHIAELRNIDLAHMDINSSNRTSSAACRLQSMFEGMKIGESRQDPPLSPISETPPPTVLTIEQELLQSTSGGLSGTPTSSGTSRSVSAAVSDESVAGDSGVFEASCRLRNSNAPTESTAQVQIKLQYSQDEQTLYVHIQKIRNLHVLSLKEEDLVYIRALLLPSVREAGAPLPVPLKLPLPLPAAAVKLQTLRLQACRREKCLGLVQVSLADYSCDTVLIKWYNILSLQNSDKIDDQGLISISCREESSDESTLISSQTSTLTRNQGHEGIQIPLTVESPRSSDDEEDEEEEEEDNDEHVNKIFNKFYLECAKDVPQILNETQEVPLTSAACTVEKETNTECNFYLEGKRITALLPNDERLSIKRSRTFSPTPQLGKNQYICRLNRSESDSSMPLYKRGTCNVQTFDRHAVARRSLRRGRVFALPGALPTRSASTRTSHTPRTSLDLELDLRAQQRRRDMLNQEIARLQDLKQRLEDARDKGNSTVANWAIEDETFAQLCNNNLVITGSSSVGTTGLMCERSERRAARALQKTYRDLHRLRKTKQPRGTPDLITFKEKMAFFTNYRPNIPILPYEDDEINLEHSTETFVNGEQLSVQLSQILGELDCETSDNVEFDEEMLNNIGEFNLNSDINDSSGGLSDIQVGYQVRRSGRCKNVVETVDVVGNIIVVKDNSECPEEEDNESLQSGDISEAGKVNLNELNSVVKRNNDKEQNEEDNNVNNETANARYQYVVDRDLGVQV